MAASCPTVKATVWPVSAENFAAITFAAAEGAPPSTHLRTRFTGGLPGKDGALKHVLAAFDADAVVVHLDDVNEGLQVGLSERHRSGGELLTHTAAESVDERRVDADCRSNIELGGLKGSLRAVATGLEAVESILEYIIEVCHAVLDQPVEPLEPVFGVGHLPLQRHDAAVEGFCPFGTTSSGGVQHCSEPLGFEEPLNQMPCDQAVKLVHPDRAAFTRAFAFADTCRAGVVAVNDAVLGGARAQGHTTPAGGAHLHTRQQYRPVFYERRDYLRTSDM